MIEIVFNDSACATLKMAQHYGVGEFSGGAFGVIVSHADGSETSAEEIEAARRDAENQMRLEWKSGAPMGGNSSDVYGFNLCLSIGDISEDVLGEKRRRTLEWLYSSYPNLDDSPSFVEEMLKRAADSLTEIRSRMIAGESIRIWYSNQPDELCGLHWFMAQINPFNLPDGRVALVALPDWEAGGDGTLTTHCGWGNIKPGDWHRYVDLQRTVPSPFCDGCVAHWRQLQRENAPLRAMLNGRLVSAPETLYDDFVNREITAAEDEFHEAMLIGKILGKYVLGIGDTWIAQRIEGMILSGDLIPVTEPAPDSPIYHRRLKKRGAIKR